MERTIHTMMLSPAAITILIATMPIAACIGGTCGVHCICKLCRAYSHHQRHSAVMPEGPQQLVIEEDLWVNVPPMQVVIIEGPQEERYEIGVDLRVKGYTREKIVS